ncbi:MAG: hypothetical protein HOD92_22985 [Deltaproteobacteria bacterium]|nr:hypothetical protein [Deltaproteobacteria bacterium]
MKRRTFIKASIMPIWATFESSFLPTIFASVQDHNKHLDIDVSVLSLTEIREKVVLSDHFDQRNIQVIGFGTSGREITRQLHTDNKDGIHDVRYNQESGDLEEVTAYEPTRLNTIFPIPPYAKEDTKQCEYLLNDTMDFDKPDTVIFVGDLDCASDFNSIAKGFDLARKKGIFAIGVITVPYDFGQNESIEINVTLNKLEKALDSLFVNPAHPGLKDVDAPFGLPDRSDDPPSKPVGSKSQEAIEFIVKCYLASEAQYLRQFDLTDVKAVLLEGRVTL